MIDLYEILGVRSTAPATEIRDAYRRLVMLSHPDRGGSAALFRLVQEAYEILSNPAARRKYDAQRIGRSPPLKQEDPSSSEQARAAQEQRDKEQRDKARRDKARRDRARRDKERRETAERQQREEAETLRRLASDPEFRRAEDLRTRSRREQEARKRVEDAIKDFHRREEKAPAPRKEPRAKVDASNAAAGQGRRATASGIPNARHATATTETSVEVPRWLVWFVLVVGTAVVLYVHRRTIIDAVLTLLAGVATAVVAVWLCWVMLKLLAAWIRR